MILDDKCLCVVYPEAVEIAEAADRWVRSAGVGCQCGHELHHGRCDAMKPAPGAGNSLRAIQCMCAAYVPAKRKQLAPIEQSRPMLPERDPPPAVCLCGHSVLSHDMENGGCYGDDMGLCDCPNFATSS